MNTRKSQQPRTEGKKTRSMTLNKRGLDVETKQVNNRKRSTTEFTNIGQNGTGGGRTTKGSSTDMCLDNGSSVSSASDVIAHLLRENAKLNKLLSDKEGKERITRESKKVKTGHGLVPRTTQDAVVVAVVPGEKVSKLTKQLLFRNFQGYIESKFFGDMKFLLNEKINKHVCQQAIKEGCVSSCQGFSGDDELCLYLENTLLPQVLNKIRHNSQSYARKKWLGT